MELLNRVFTSLDVGHVTKCC